MSTTFPGSGILAGAARQVRRLFSPAPERVRADRILARIIGHVRNPGFYQAGGVADTIDGRFDLMALHVAAMVHALRQQGQEGALAGRALEEAMFDNLDAAMREQGISDMGVPRRMKSLSSAWFGRLIAYGKAFATSDPAEMSEILLRNLYRGVPPSAPQIATMVDYVGALNAALAAQGAAILHTENVFMADVPSDGRMPT